MGLGSVITTKDLLQCLFRVPVVCGGQVQRGRQNLRLMLPNPGALGNSRMT